MRPCSCVQMLLFSVFEFSLFLCPYYLDLVPSLWVWWWTDCVLEGAGCTFPHAEESPHSFWFPQELTVQEREKNISSNLRSGEVKGFHMSISPYIMVYEREYRYLPDLLLHWSWVFDAHLNKFLHLKDFFFNHSMIMISFAFSKRFSNLTDRNHCHFVSPTTFSDEVKYVSTPSLFNYFKLHYLQNKNCRK